MWLMAKKIKVGAERRRKIASAGRKELLWKFSKERGQRAHALPHNLILLWITTREVRSQVMMVNQSTATQIKQSQNLRL